MPEQSENIVNQLQELFNDIYLNKKNDNNVRCLYYPIIKQLAEKNGDWVSREDIQNDIKEKFDLTDETFGRSSQGGGLGLDHFWSQRFEVSETKGLFSLLFEHDAVNNGDRKNKFKLKPEYSEAVSKFLDEYPLVDEDIKFCIEEGIEALNKRDIRVWKMSHGKSETNMSDADNDWLIENFYIAQGWTLDGSSGKGQGKKFKNMKVGDYFYLVRNASIILFGKIIDNKPSNTPPNLKSISGWHMRKFELVKDISADKFLSNNITGHQFWKPQGQCTISEIKKNELLDFENQILQPAFKMTLNDLGIKITETDIIKVENMDVVSNKKPTQLNQILFGPPGTGKTYNTINKALDIIGKDIGNKSRAAIKKILIAK